MYLSSGAKKYTYRKMGIASRLLLVILLKLLSELQLMKCEGQFTGNGGVSYRNMELCLSEDIFLKNLYVIRHFTTNTN